MNDKKTQLRCPGCGKRLLDATGPYKIEVWCKTCKKTILFNAEGLDKAEKENLPSSTE